jgi:hypothetical protein
MGWGVGVWGWVKDASRQTTARRGWRARPPAARQTQPLAAARGPAACRTWIDVPAFAGSTPARASRNGRPEPSRQLVVTMASTDSPIALEFRRLPFVTYTRRKPAALSAPPRSTPTAACSSSVSRMHSSDVSSAPVAWGAGGERGRLAAVGEGVVAPAARAHLGWAIRMQVAGGVLCLSLWKGPLPAAHQAADDLDAGLVAGVAARADAGGGGGRGGGRRNG